ncbi:hypothetical protein [Curvivirga sp.]|uniref:hypothetical protein n=1 Tax=Curvivirga sp. TaxID=2856848 RepID=UPI003B5C1D9F
MQNQTAQKADEDIDLFDDFDLDCSFQEDGENLGEEFNVDPEAIRRSVEEFHKIFTQQEGDLSVASGAMLMYQHLQAAGYQTDISIEDQKAIVSASSENQELKMALIDRVEDLLDEMVVVEHNWKTDNFNVHSISTNTLKDQMSVTIQFHTI